MEESHYGNKWSTTPTYDIAKTITADATVEAEYGNNVVEGTKVTLAHHGPRSNNPAPCNTPDVPELPASATIVHKSLLKIL